MEKQSDMESTSTMENANNPQYLYIALKNGKERIFVWRYIDLEIEADIRCLVVRREKDNQLVFVAPLENVDYYERV